MSNRTPSAYSIPPARKVSPLRQRMIDDMTVRNLAPNTMLCYLKQVSYLARYFGRSPAQLGPEEIREYELYLAQDRKVSVSSRLVAITALRFLYGVTLKRDRFIEMLPTPRKEHYLPVILSPAEVLRFLQAAPSYSHHVIFSTMYGTGMRVSEALHLRACHIDSQRMMIRIEQSKGESGPRRPAFPEAGATVAHLLAEVSTAGVAFPRARSPSAAEPRGRGPSRNAGFPSRRSDQETQPTLLTTRICRPSIRGRDRPPQDSAPAGSPQFSYHSPLPSSDHQHGLRHHQPIGSTPLPRH